MRILVIEDNLHTGKEYNVAHQTLTSFEAMLQSVLDGKRDSTDRMLDPLVATAGFAYGELVLGDPTAWPPEETEQHWSANSAGTRRRYWSPQSSRPSGPLGDLGRNSGADPPRPV
jgi:hypothetical protein